MKCYDMTVDMIVTNAKVLTMDEARPRAEAVAVAAGKIVAVGTGAEVGALAGPQPRVSDAGGWEGAGRRRAGGGAVAVAAGKIVAVGTGAEVGALAGPQTRVIDAGGRTLLPGFVESHLHLVLGGNELVQLQIGGLHGFEALKAAFAGYAVANPDNAILMAQGASYEILDHPVTRHDLDRVIADRPIAMMSPDHHTVWANTAALSAAGLLHGAAMPHGHEVVMAADGTATGELREFEAFGPILA